MQNKYFSHKDHSLEDHSFETGKKSRNTVRKKDLNLSIIDKKTLEIIVFIQGLIHDFGKFMIYFQDYFLKNFNKELMKNFHLKDHSFISALVAYEVIKQYTKDEMLAMIVFNSIRKHHGNLESPLVDIANNRCQVNNLKKQFDSLVLEDIEKFYDKHLLKYGINIKDIVIGIKEKIEDDPYEYLEDLRFEFIALIDMYEKDKEDVAIERFLLFNFLYSVLIDTDKKDSAKITEGYFEGAAEKKISVKDFIKYMQEKHSEIYDPNKSINKLRDEFFNSVVDNKKIKKENYIYTLKAPTGIGKTFTILELSERLNQINGGKYKIIYGLPLTSIIDQNYDVLENILEFNLKEEYEKYPSKYLIKDHYLSDLKIEENQETKNFSDVLNSELLLKSWCSSHIVTTFVQIFHSVLGNTNNLLRKFHNMSNSIIIMDEIQSIPPKYHKIWGKIIKVLAKNFKIYFIFLTATQPEILSEEDYIDLSNENVNRDEEFNRVVVKTIKNLMPITIDVFLDEFKNVFKGSNVLLVMNTKDSALTAYKELKKMYLDYEVISLTGFKASIDRSKTIEYIKRKLRKKEKIIVVATQLVEAGVNLDFDLGFRDLTTFDSLVQFCGRINRNNDLKPQKGEVYVFNLQTNYGQAYAEQVYRESIPLLNITKNILTTRKDIYSKDFMDLSKEYFRLVKENYQYESDRILDAIKILNFGNYAHRKEIAIDKIKLIENNDTRRIIICKTKEINEKVLRLKECLKKSSEIFEFEEKKDLYIEIKKISKELSQYEVVVRKKHIKPYKDILKTIKEDDLYFADYENFEKIYSKDIGFKKKEGRK